MTKKNFLDSLNNKRTYFEDITNSIEQAEYYKQKYQNNINEENEYDLKLSCISECVDEIILSYFIEALRFPSLFITSISEDTPKNKLTFEECKEIVENIYFKKGTFLSYLHDKIRQHILNSYFIEAILLHDHETYITQAQKKKRISNTTKVLCDYINIRDGHSYERIQSVTRSTEEDLIKALRKCRKKAHNNYEFPRVVPLSNVLFKEQQFPDTPYMDALEIFHDEFNYKYTIDKYASYDIAFLNWVYEDFADWLSPNFFPYYGILLDTLNRKKKQNQLFHYCETYKNKRVSEKKHNRSREYNNVLESYEFMKADISALLENLDKDRKVHKYICYANKFLLNHFTRNNFLASLKSDLYAELSSRCNIHTLINHDSNALLLPLEKESVFYYSFIKLLFYFDIDMKQLASSDFGSEHNNKNDISLTSFTDFTCLNDDLCLPINLIYNFLYSVHSNMGSILSAINDIYKLTNIRMDDNTKSPIINFTEIKRNKESEIYRDATLLEKYAELLSPVEPRKHELNDPLDDNQAFLNVLLLYSSSTSGPVLFNNNLGKK